MSLRNQCEIVFFVLILSAELVIFYPFGSAAGDTERFINYNKSYDYVSFSTPFSFFGRTYNHTYVRIQFHCQIKYEYKCLISQFILDLNWFLQFQVNDNGLLTFNQPSLEAQPSSFPTHGAEDYIAPLWTDLNDFGMGVYSYQQYTNGSVLTRATRDINQYFPQRAFTASWVFVTTWDFVQTRNTSVFNHHSAPVNHFLIFSFQTQGGRLYRPSIIRFSFSFFFSRQSHFKWC